MGTVRCGTASTAAACAAVCSGWPSPGLGVCTSLAPLGQLATGPSTEVVHPIPKTPASSAHDWSISSGISRSQSPQRPTLPLHALHGRVDRALRSCLQ